MKVIVILYFIPGSTRAVQNGPQDKERQHFKVLKIATLSTSVVWWYPCTRLNCQTPPGYRKAHGCSLVKVSKKQLISYLERISKRQYLGLSNWNYLNNMKTYCLQLGYHRRKDEPWFWRDYIPGTFLFQFSSICLLQSHSLIEMVAVVPNSCLYFVSSNIVLW